MCPGLYFQAPYGGWYKQALRRHAGERGRIQEQLDQLGRLAASLLGEMENPT
jgi:hypothetical protein